MLIRFDIIQERDGHTHTHHMTAQAPIMHNIARQPVRQLQRDGIKHRAAATGLLFSGEINE